MSKNASISGCKTEPLNCRVRSGLTLLLIRTLVVIFCSTKYLVIIIGCLKLSLKLQNVGITVTKF